jgi:hypothetical protein
MISPQKHGTNSLPHDVIRNDVTIFPGYIAKELQNWIPFLKTTHVLKKVKCRFSLIYTQFMY